MLNTIFVMLCGCRLGKDDLIVHESFKSCPTHKKRVKTVHKICRNCGSEMTLPHTSRNKTNCDTCQKIFDKISTVYHVKKFTEYINPWLHRKTLKAVLFDISTNLWIGYDAIQIDYPEVIKFAEKKNVIDLEQKTKILESEISQMDTDCTTCSKVTDCHRPAECLNRDFAFWSGKINGIIVKRTKEKIHVKSKKTGEIYVLNQFAQKNPGIFHVNRAEAA